MKADKFEKSLIKSKLLLKKIHAIAIKDDNENFITTCYIIRLLQPLMSLSEPTKPSSTIKRTGIWNHNIKLKNWLYNNLGNIYCFTKKKNMKKGFITTENH
jgi:hypothetical protein